MLPLDLHVLSLPLAFILSQDQTLHSNFLLQVRKPVLFILPDSNKLIIELLILSFSPSLSMNLLRYLPGVSFPLS